MALREVGLMHSNDALTRQFFNLKHDVWLELPYNGIIIGIKLKTKNEIKFKAFGFTSAGEELAELIDNKPNLDYMKMLSQEYSNDETEFKKIVIKDDDTIEIEDF